MIRAFTLRDIPLVHRLSEQGVLFHTEYALTQAVHPLREALVNMLIGGQYPTYVWRDEDGSAAGFVQLRQNEQETHAHIVCLGSRAGKDGSDEALWVPFLEQVIAEAGRHGIQSLIAEVNELGEELLLLRKVGFAVYTRQDIWMVEELAEEQIAAYDRYVLVPATAVDEWDIHLLYANIVPRLIQLVEPVPPDWEQTWVIRDEKETLVAFVHFGDGSAATWLRIFIHPEAQENGLQILAAALQVKPPATKYPIYCAVRRYQSWLQTPLESLGFQFGTSQALMVRHTTVQQNRQTAPRLHDLDSSQLAVAQRQWLTKQHLPEPKHIHQQPHWSADNH